jgi:hypothetical protein
MKCVVIVTALVEVAAVLTHVVAAIVHETWNCSPVISTLIPLMAFRASRMSENFRVKTPDWPAPGKPSHMSPYFEKVMDGKQRQ